MLDELEPGIKDYRDQRQAEMKPILVPCVGYKHDHSHDGVEPRIGVCDYSIFCPIGWYGPVDPP